MDEITANEIMSSILSIEGLTSIVVTHRLDENVLKRYDGIIVLHNGKVEECGTFEKLLEKEGYFYSLALYRFAIDFCKTSGESPCSMLW